MASISANGGEICRALVNHMGHGPKFWWVLTANGALLARPEGRGGYIKVRQMSGRPEDNPRGYMEHACGMRGMNIISFAINNRNGATDDD